MFQQLILLIKKVKEYLGTILPNKSISLTILSFPRMLICIPCLNVSKAK
jgi:hypothetical protein